MIRLLLTLVSLTVCLAVSPIMAASIGSGTTASPQQVQVVEYYHSGLDHYFVTADPTEISALDAARFKGWARTGYEFTAYSGPLPVNGMNPVCRLYGRPQAGLDSHFYSAAPDECADVLNKFASSWILESASAFQVLMPDRGTGACSGGAVPVYRVFNNRSDANHRYTTDQIIRNAMVVRGYISEGYGADNVAFCALAATTLTPSSPTAGTPAVSILATQMTPDTFAFGSAITSATAIVSYAWDFGDGGSETGPTTTHQFKVSGTFPVVLTVTDNRAASGRATKSVTATAAPTMPPTPTPTATSTATDFVARRSAPGVIRWFDFDTTSQLGAMALGANYGTQPGDQTTAVIDTSVKASGEGSIRFDVPSRSSANAAGAWYANFTPDLSRRFGENTEFFVQWRQRFNRAFIDTLFLGTDGDPQGGIKQSIIGPGDTPSRKWASCETIHTVVQSYYQYREPIAYNSCTGSGTHGAYAGMYEALPDGDFKLQNGTTPYCHYRSTGAGAPPGVGPGCVGWVADEWMTFQVGIMLGPRNNVTNDFDNSRYRLWVAREGKPSVLVIDWKPGVGGYLPLAAGPISEDQQFGKVWLLPYMTGKSSTQVHPLAQTWYDEVIISAQRIADPAVAPSPTLHPTSAGVPAWRQGKSVGEFFQIGNTAKMGGITSGATWSSGPVDLWNGLGAGPTSWWSAAAGGDGDPVNAVISIDLASDSPKWTLNGAPSPPSAYSLTSPYYTDGLPVARHTYFSTQFITAAHDRTGVDRVMLFSDFAAYGIFKTGQFGGGPQVDGFRVRDAQWDPAGTWQNVPFIGPTPMSFAKDPTNENVYMAGGYRFAKWTAATGLWSEFSPVGTPHVLAWDDLPSVVDASRHRLVVIHDGRPYYNVGLIRLQVIDLVANNYVDIPVTGAITALNGYGGAMVHDTDNDRYLLFWNHGDATTDVFAINPDTGSSSLVANVAQKMQNTMYARAAYFSLLGGVAYLPSFASNILFMPTR
jgi:PKD repeat protein